MRTKGSCRFKPYYKVQFRNEFLAWQDVQKSHSTVDDARHNFLPGKVCRIIEVTEHGRKPIE